MSNFSFDDTLLQNPDFLAEQWHALRVQHHHLHSPDAARRLQVPEAALMASHQGRGAWSLKPALAELLGPLADWSRVILVARNGLGVGMVLGSGYRASMLDGWLHLQEPTGQSELFVQPSAVHEVWLLEDHDAHGHTFSLNAFDGQGHAILRVFLMSKRGRELALPYLMGFETDRTRGAWAAAAPDAAPCDPALTAKRFRTPELRAVGTANRVSLKRLLTGCMSSDEPVATYFERVAQQKDPITIRFCGASIGFQYDGSFGKTSTTPGAVHAHSEGFKLHLRLAGLGSVSVDTVCGLRAQDRSGGWIEVSPPLAKRPQQDQQDQQDQQAQQAQQALQDQQPLQAQQPAQPQRRALLQALISLPVIGALGILTPPGQIRAQTQAQTPTQSRALLGALGTRWLSLQSFVSEIVVSLGGADRIVAVGGGQEHLTELSDRPRIPGFRQTSAEMLLALAPTDLLVTQEHLMPQTLQQLEAAGVRVHLLDARSDEAGVIARIAQIGQLLQTEAAAQDLSRQFAEALAMQRGQATWRTAPRGVFILAGGGRPTVVAGGDTHPGALLRLAGAQNLADSLSGFKSLSQEFLAAAQPEFILTNPDGLQGDPPVVLSAPGARLTAATQQQRLVALPGYLLQGMGIHTPQAIAQLHEALRPWFD